MTLGRNVRQVHLGPPPPSGASESERIDYIIEVQTAALQMFESLNATTARLVEIQGLAFALDPLRYIGRKLRSGEAFRDMGQFYIPIGAGATIAVMMTNPVGYVWLGLREGIRVSQPGVIEYTRLIDGTPLPWAHVPRVVDIDINWSETLPFGVVIKEIYGATYTNHDAFDQWIITGWWGAYIRKEIWEKDSRLMDLAAEAYIQDVEATYG